jgi:hypothetical protein
MVLAVSVHHHGEITHSPRVLRVHLETSEAYNVWLSEHVCALFSQVVNRSSGLCHVKMVQLPLHYMGFSATMSGSEENSGAKTWSATP